MIQSLASTPESAPKSTKTNKKNEEVSSETEENGTEIEIKINEKEHMKVLQEGNGKITLKIEIEGTDQHWRSRRGVAS